MGQILCVVPARSGSVGVPGKNVAKVFGVPLVARALQHSFNLTPDSLPLLSTDGQDVIDAVCSTFGLSPVCLDDVEPNKVIELGSFLLHRRPQQLASSTAKIADVLMEIRSSLKDLKMSYSKWVLLQPTSPFRSELELVALRDSLVNVSPSSSIVSVTDVGAFHPARMYNVADDGRLSSLAFDRSIEAANRQDLPSVYIRDGGFYVIGDSLVEKAKQFSDRPQALVREFPWTINVDKPEDLALARAIDSPSGQGAAMERLEAS